MADDAQQKTLPATPRRIRKAREDGQVARSRDLGHLVAIGGAGMLLLGFGAPLLQRLQSLMGQALRFDAAALADATAMHDALAGIAWLVLAFALPLGAVLWAMAAAAGVLSGGWNFTLKAIEPRLDKLDPLKGLKRMASKDQLVTLLKACLLALLLLAIGAGYLGLHAGQFAALLALPPERALTGAGELVVAGLLLLVLALGVFALVDVPLQRHLLAQRLRMSHQEMKQELKETEGSAEVKGRIRARMRALATRRMMAAVPSADVVVMNPSHYAVALKYDEAGGGAPRVVAKGADLLALRIRDAARAARVPILQAPPLARALYAHCELGQEIPAALFAAVAQVLAWVFQLRAASEIGMAPPEAPQALPVPPGLDPLDPRAAGARAAGRRRPREGAEA
ncbi:MAG: EscU/YscU/HrcU family type III secretion system export apparatus switch protein [Burkholderiales bacterium]|nr:EscU/YscU/HrcU family type III secretion system export apparatus switch protein [Burkholderiales bacterium]